MIEEALQEKLYIRNRHPAGQKVNLITVDGNGLKPGVDIDKALAIEHGCTWMTTDRDYSRFEGLKTEYPV